MNNPRSLFAQGKTFRPVGLRKSIAPLVCVFFASLITTTRLHAQEFDHTYKLWNSVLQEFVVVSGKKSAVRYSRLKDNHEQLTSYIQIIEALPESDFRKFTEEQQVAFLINAYNALTLKWILQHYPTNSIKDTTGLLSSPWKQRFFTLFGQQQHLDHIEHERLRKHYKEPRIHFALVCAARSCPPLRSEAFIAGNLDTQLNDAAKNFLNDPERNYIDQKKNRLYLSKIFDWFKADFTSTGVSLVNYVLPFMSNIPESIKPDELSVSYLDYDWSLNEAK